MLGNGIGDGLFDKWDVENFFEGALIIFKLTLILID